MAGGLANRGFYVPGPCELYVGDALTGVLAFLGESPESVQPVDETYFTPVMLDKAGPQMASDEQFMGKGLLLAVTLGRFDLATLEGFCTTIVGQTNSGVINYGDIGTFMQLQGNTRRLFLKSTYAGAKQPDMPNGFNILAARVERRTSPRGVTRQIMSLVIRAVPVTNYCNGSFTLWNYDSTGVPASSC